MITKRATETNREVYRNGLAAISCIASIKGTTQWDANPKIYNELVMAWRNDDRAALEVARSRAHLEARRACRG